MSFLSVVVQQKHLEVAERRKTRSLNALRDRPQPALRDFTAAISLPGLAVIAEIKRRSPSKGVLRENLDPVALAASYQSNGAAAISVLTDSAFFSGSAEDLTRVKISVALPVLRKDFTVDTYQIHEARYIGADAILLMVRLLSDAQLREFLSLSNELGLSAIVEVHDEKELERALTADAGMIGVNNRDLESFEVDTTTAFRVRRAIPPGRITIAESGVQTREDLRRLEEAGFDAALVGETLLVATDAGQELRHLLGAKS